MKLNKYLLITSQIIIGLTFIFSGFVKAVDPMGSIIKIQEYFIAFNLQWLSSFSTIFAFILCCYEFPLGVAILLGSRGRLMSWLLLICMSFFTVLTFYLALKNPVNDCGCFGDAIKLTNWQTFYKNLIFMVFTLIIFFNRKKITTVFKKWGEWGSIITGTIIILFVSIYSYLYLPIIDFLPFKEGNDIIEKMTMPPDKKGDEYETVLIYKNKKTGKLHEYSLENIPMDENWEWQETQNKLIKKGYSPTIKDFIIYDKTGKEAGQEFLKQSGYKMVIVYHKLDEKEVLNQNKINELARKVAEDGIVKIWAITASSSEFIDQFIQNYKPLYNLYQADIVMLEMMIRSNPGILLIKDTKIIKKWPGRCIPTYENFSKYLYQ